MALSADKNTPMKDGQLVALAVAADGVLYAGGMAAIDGDGYAVAASDAAGLRVFGRSEEQVDNTGGSDGDLTVKVRRGKAFRYENSATNPVTVDEIGRVVYVEDDETVASDPGTNAVAAGTCVGVDDDGVWVEHGALIGAEVADSTASDVAGIVADHNTLLAALRAADIIAS